MECIHIGLARKQIGPHIDKQIYNTNEKQNKCKTENATVRT